MDDWDAALLVAAYWVLGRDAISRDEIDFDSFNKLRVRGQRLRDAVSPETEDRIGALKHVIMDLVGRHDQPRVIELLHNELATPSRPAARWVFKNLGSELIEVVGEFLFVKDRRA